LEENLAPAVLDNGIASPKEGNDSISNSNIVKSLLPMFIKKKFNKLPKIFLPKAGITISIVIYIVFYIITNYFPNILEHINYFFNYKTFGYLSIFVIFYIIYTLFELLITYYFVISQPQEGVENKIFNKLPKYIKKDIISFRKNDSTEDKDFFKKQYMLFIITHLISLIISFVIIIISLIIF